MGRGSDGRGEHKVGVGPFCKPPPAGRRLCHPGEALRAAHVRVYPPPPPRLPRPYLDGLVGVPPRHRPSDQFAVEVLHGAAATGAHRLLAAGGGGGDTGALGQVEVGRVKAVPVHIAGKRGGRAGGGGERQQQQQQQQQQPPQPRTAPLRRPRHLHTEVARAAGAGNGPGLPRPTASALRAAPPRTRYFCPGGGEGPPAPCAAPPPLTLSLGAAAGVLHTPRTHTHSWSRPGNPPPSPAGSRSVAGGEAKWGEVIPPPPPPP